MEPGLRTPLLDFFRRGEVARDVRLLAAQGALAPRAHEQLGLLMLLVSDPDPDVAATAESTLRSIPVAALAAFLARSDVSTELRAFFATRGIEPAETPSTDADGPLLDPGGKAAADAAGAESAAGATEEEDAAAEGETRVKESTVQKLASMTVAQRMSVAMKGSREERAILIRDPNKIVSVAVLSSPKLTEAEVEAFSKMANVSDEILRIIATTRAWVKNYNVIVGLVKNPKTPVAMSMNLLNRLNERDMRMISTDRNVPEVLRVTARKKVVIDK